MKSWSHAIALAVMLLLTEILYYVHAIDLETAVVAQQSSLVTLAVHKLFSFLFKKGQIMDDIKFQELRDAWALKAPVPAESQLRTQQERDRQLNPHNDNYANKPPLRSTNEIHSDLAYKFADDILLTQYPNDYSTWLLANGYKTVHHRTRKVG